MSKDEFVHWLAYLRMSGNYGGSGGGAQTPTINKFKAKLGKMRK